MPRTMADEGLEALTLYDRGCGSLQVASTNGPSAEVVTLDTTPPNFLGAQPSAWGQNTAKSRRRQQTREGS